MALNAAALKGNILSAMASQGFVFGDTSKADTMAEAIADAVVDHITTAGVVTVTVTGSSATGGAVTGTGVGSMT